MTNFLATILIGRFCGVAALGVYSLVFTLMVLVTCVHQSLLMTPYTVYVHRLAGAARHGYAGSVFVHHAGLSILALAGLAVVASLFQLGYGPRGLAPPLWILAAAVPFILLREFGRRHAFAHLRVPTAIAIDGAVSAVQILGMAAMAVMGWLTPAATFAVVGIGSGAVGLMWFVLTRREFAFDRSQVVPQLRRNLQFGRWIFASQITFLIHSYMIHWLLAFQHDTQTKATGIFTACTMIVYLSNPFVLGVGNVLQPWVARSFAEGGLKRGWRVVWRGTLLLGGAMSLFFLVVHIFGGELMRLFYGDQYLGHEATVSILAAGILVSATTMAMMFGLWGIGVPSISFIASLCGMGATLLTGIWLIDSQGHVGAAWALFVGNATASLITSGSFVYFMRRSVGRQSLSPSMIADEIATTESSELLVCPATNQP